ncbi:MAG: heme exporter protein CcmD [Pseudomonadales bacterium]|nr:heme exporter protein CcmD [Pseudomonadales bacterium]
MYFESFEAFIAMGTHGLYVWSAYAIGILVLSLNLLLPVLNKRSVMAKQRAKLRREQQRKRTPK